MAEGLTMLLAGNADGALSKFDMALGFDLNDTDGHCFTLRKSLRLTATSKMRITRYRMPQLDSRNPFCGFQRIETLTYEGHYDLAIKEYARLIQWAKYPWLDAAVGDADLAKGDVASALKHFNALAESGRSRKCCSHQCITRWDRHCRCLPRKTDRRAESARRAHGKLGIILCYSESSLLSADGEIHLYGTERQGGMTQRALPGCPIQAESAYLLAIIFPAMVHDFVAARAILKGNSEDAAALGQSYPAAEQFIDGLEAIERHEMG